MITFPIVINSSRITPRKNNVKIMTKRAIEVKTTEQDEMFVDI